MIKNECDIVKDLIPSYMENELSSSSKEFIEKHIENCSDCKKLLAELKEEKNKKIKMKK